MTRPGYNPYAQEHRECPKCRYPMLRAEKLGGVSDQVSAFEPRESWLPGLVYQVPLGVLAIFVSLSLTSGLALFYRFLLDLTHRAGLLWLAGLPVLGLELALAWHIVRWAGWQQMFRAWASGASTVPHGVWQNEKAWTSIRQRRSDSGLAFLPALWLGCLPALTTQLYPLFSHEAMRHQTALGTLLTVTVLLICLLLSLGLPVFYDDARGQSSRMRRQRRQELMRELDPGDWVCPNCLYAEKA